MWKERVKAANQAAAEAHSKASMLFKDMNDERCFRRELQVQVQACQAENSALSSKVSKAFELEEEYRLKIHELQSQLGALARHHSAQLESSQQDTVVLAERLASQDTQADEMREHLRMNVKLQQELHQSRKMCESEMGKSKALQHQMRELEDELVQYRLVLAFILYRALYRARFCSLMTLLILYRHKM